jgi:hypothetical protein
MTSDKQVTSRVAEWVTTAAGSDGTYESAGYLDLLSASRWQTKGHFYFNRELPPGTPEKEVGRPASR